MDRKVVQLKKQKKYHLELFKFFVELDFCDNLKKYFTKMYQIHIYLKFRLKLLELFNIFLNSRLVIS